MTPEILTEIFPQKENNGRSIKTVMYGSETISSLGPKIWGILTTELKWIVSYTIQKENPRVGPKEFP